MNAPVRLLVVEDEVNVARTLTERLVQEGYNVVWARSGAEAIAHTKSHTMAPAGAHAAAPSSAQMSTHNAAAAHAATSTSTQTSTQHASAAFDLALLDVGLPDQSGFDVAKVLREHDPRTAIVFLTALGTPEDRVRGLELGAEDYIVKPFHFKELLLRIQNALRRVRLLASTESKFDKPLLVGRARIDLKRMEVTVEGLSAALTHKECAVLSLLLEKQGAVLTRDEILDRAWAQDEFPTPRTVDNFILRLRKLIEPDPGDPRVIRSIRGVGYLLDTEAVKEA